MSVKFAEVRSVRIICDGQLKNRILDQLPKLGAAGYTWWEAHGKGEHETISDLYSGLDRVYIEVWCCLEVAEKILGYCLGPQFRGVGMTVGVDTLLVAESEAGKFAAKK